MSTTESLFRGIKLSVEDVGRGAQCRTEYTRAEARDFAIRAIRLKSPLLKSRLRTLLYNHGAAQYLDDILAQLCQESCIEDDGCLGFISETGDGKKGLMGNGPITYTWRNCTKETQSAKDNN